MVFYAYNSEYIGVIYEDCTGGPTASHRFPIQCEEYTTYFHVEERKREKNEEKKDGKKMKNKEVRKSNFRIF